jgi:hypothetical protein
VLVNEQITELSEESRLCLKDKQQSESMLTVMFVNAITYIFILLLVIVELQRKLAVAEDRIRELETSHGAPHVCDHYILSYAHTHSLVDLSTKIN